MVKEICHCGNKLVFLREHTRYFCKKCRTYPPTCPNCRRDLFWVPEYSRYYCNACVSYKEPAKPVTPTSSEKAVAPTPTTTPSQPVGEKHSLKEIEDAFNELKSNYQSGSIDKDRFKEILQNMKFKDEYSRFWTIGTKTGRWYYHDGARWAEAKPPQSLEGRIFRLTKDGKIKNGAKLSSSTQANDFCIECGVPKPADKEYCTKCGTKQK